MNVFDRIVLPLTGLIAIYIITSSRLQSCWSRVSLGPGRNRPRGGRSCHGESRHHEVKSLPLWA